MPYAYRKSERIRKNSEFVSVMKRGKRLSIDGLSLFYAENGMGDFRIGISVGKKLAGAVGRNRLKRRIRSSIARTIAGEARGYDLVFVARREIVGTTFENVRRAVEEILGRSSLRIRRAGGASP